MKNYSDTENSVDLVPSKSGKIFDGVLRVASIGFSVAAKVYESDRYPDGAWIQTSKIVKVGEVPYLGKYIETKSGSRYLVESTMDSSNWFECLERYISKHIDYFKPIQWS